MIISTVVCCCFCLDPSPCQGHGGDNFHCFIALTVENPEMVPATVVFEYSYTQIAVVRVGFTDSTVNKLCEMIKSSSFIESFCSYYCQFRKIIF